MRRKSKIKYQESKQQNRRRAVMTSSILLFAFCIVLFPVGGCAPPPGAGPVAEQTAGSERKVVESSPPTLPAGFAPVRISILPLTELTGPGAESRGAALHVYVALLDAFGSPIKAPGVLRFELYRYVPRSAEPRGQRIKMWSDMDLTRPAENNKSWRDFLRAYEFELDAPAGLDETYILEATCTCPDGKRLSADFTLKSSQ
jgi:hypothetical protein